MRELANASATTPGIIPGSINPPKETHNLEGHKSYVN